jgi:hypothetical protein
MREADVARAQAKEAAARDAATKKAAEETVKKQAEEASSAVAGLKAALAGAGGAKKIKRKGTKDEEAAAAVVASTEAAAKDAKDKKSKESSSSSSTHPPSLRKKTLAVASEASESDSDAPTPTHANPPAASTPAHAGPANVFLNYDSKKVTALSKHEMEVIFSHYADIEKHHLSLKHAPDSIGEKSSTMKLMASHICDAVMQMFRVGLKLKETKMTEKQIEEMVVKERAFMLPGNTEDPLKNTKFMARSLMDTMDMMQSVGGSASCVLGCAG